MENLADLGILLGGLGLLLIGTGLNWFISVWSKKK
jgi:hypothetical protein